MSQQLQLQQQSSLVPMAQASEVAEHIVTALEVLRQYGSNGLFEGRAAGCDELLEAFDKGSLYCDLFQMQDPSSNASQPNAYQPSALLDYLRKAMSLFTEFSTSLELLEVFVSLRFIASLREIITTIEANIARDHGITVGLVISIGSRIVTVLILGGGAVIAGEGLKRRAFHLISREAHNVACRCCDIDELFDLLKKYQMGGTLSSTNNNYNNKSSNSSSSSSNSNSNSNSSVTSQLSADDKAKYEWTVASISVLDTRVSPNRKNQMSSYVSEVVNNAVLDIFMAARRRDIESTIYRYYDQLISMVSYDDKDGDTIPPSSSSIVASNNASDEGKQGSLVSTALSIEGKNNYVSVVGGEIDSKSLPVRDDGSEDSDDNDNNDSNNISSRYADIDMFVKTFSDSKKKLEGLSSGNYNYGNSNHVNDDDNNDDNNDNNAPNTNRNENKFKINGVDLDICSFELNDLKSRKVVEKSGGNGLYDSFIDDDDDSSSDDATVADIIPNGNTNFSIESNYNNNSDNNNNYNNDYNNTYGNSSSRERLYSSFTEESVDVFTDDNGNNDNDYDIEADIIGDLCTSADGGNGIVVPEEEPKDNDFIADGGRDLVDGGLEDSYNNGDSNIDIDVDFNTNNNNNNGSSISGSNGAAESSSDFSVNSQICNEQGLASTSDNIMSKIEDILNKFNNDDSTSDDSSEVGGDEINESIDNNITTANIEDEGKSNLTRPKSATGVSSSSVSLPSSSFLAKESNAASSPARFSSSPLTSPTRQKIPTFQDGYTISANANILNGSSSMEQHNTSVTTSIEGVLIMDTYVDSDQIDGKHVSVTTENDRIRSYNPNPISDGSSQARIDRDPDFILPKVGIISPINVTSSLASSSVNSFQKEHHGGGRSDKNYICCDDEAAAAAAVVIKGESKSLNNSPINSSHGRNNRYSNDNSNNDNNYDNNNNSNRHSNHGKFPSNPVDEFQSLVDIHPLRKEVADVLRESLVNELLKSCDEDVIEFSLRGYDAIKNKIFSQIDWSQLGTSLSMSIEDLKPLADSIIKSASIDLMKSSEVARRSSNSSLQFNSNVLKTGVLLRESSSNIIRASLSKSISNAISASIMNQSVESGNVILRSSRSTLEATKNEDIVAVVIDSSYPPADTLLSTSFVSEDVNVSGHRSADASFLDDRSSHHDRSHENISFGDFKDHDSILEFKQGEEEDNDEVHNSTDYICDPNSIPSGGRRSIDKLSADALCSTSVSVAHKSPSSSSSSSSSSSLPKPLAAVHKSPPSMAELETSEKLMKVQRDIVDKHINEIESKCMSLYNHRLALFRKHFSSIASKRDRDHIEGAIDVTEVVIGKTTNNNQPTDYNNTDNKELINYVVIEKPKSSSESVKVNVKVDKNLNEVNFPDVDAQDNYVVLSPRAGRENERDKTREQQLLQAAQLAAAARIQQQERRREVPAVTLVTVNSDNRAMSARGPNEEEGSKRGEAYAIFIESDGKVKPRALSAGHSRLLSGGPRSNSSGGGSGGGGGGSRREAGASEQDPRTDDGSIMRGNSNNYNNAGSSTRNNIGIGDNFSVASTNSGSKQSPRIGVTSKALSIAHQQAIIPSAGGGSRQQDGSVSNSNRIRNALRKVCLAGSHQAPVLEDALQTINDVAVKGLALKQNQNFSAQYVQSQPQSESLVIQQMVILLFASNTLSFRGIYAVVSSLGELHRIYGRGPSIIDIRTAESTSVISNYYKYDSTARNFVALPLVKAITNTTDAISVDPSQIKRKN